MSVSQKLWPSLPLQHRIRRMWWTYAALAFLAVVASLWTSGEIGQHRAEAALEEQARMDVTLNAALLRTVLEKYRALPFVLSQDTALAAALVGNDASARSSGSVRSWKCWRRARRPPSSMSSTRTAWRFRPATGASRRASSAMTTASGSIFRGRSNEDRPSTSRSARSARNRVFISRSGFRAAMACWVSLWSRSNSTTSRRIGTPPAPRPTSLTSVALSSSPVFHHGGS